ncbi:cold-shock protein [Reyranella sp.]|uniref:cold-shock protein n=1 Tax=Reyranella sp. TaxID=1929291 RepID=UPI003D11B97D
MKRRTFVIAGAATLSIPLIARAQARVSGVVKWWDESRGLGFITPVRGGDDVLVRIDAVQRAGLFGLSPGQPITYVLHAIGDKAVAVDLKTE